MKNIPRFFESIHRCMKMTENHFTCTSTRFRQRNIICLDCLRWNLHMKPKYKSEESRLIHNKHKSVENNYSERRSLNTTLSIQLPSTTVRGRDKWSVQERRKENRSKNGLIDKSVALNLNNLIFLIDCMVIRKSIARDTNPRCGDLIEKYYL